MYPWNVGYLGGFMSLGERRLLLSKKYHITVILQKLLVWLLGFWKMDGRSVVSLKPAELILGLFNSVGNANSVVCVDCYMALIKCTVMKHIEQDSVTTGKALCLWVAACPWLDVTCNEQGGHGKSRNATCTPVRGEESASEILLINAALYDGHLFSAFW